MLGWSKASISELAQESVEEIVGDGEGFDVGCREAVGTPLFQTNFLPLLMQVYFNPLYV